MLKCPVIALRKRCLLFEPKVRGISRDTLAAVVLLLLTTCLSACFSSGANSASANLSNLVPAHVYTVTEENTTRQVQAVGSLFPWEESALSSEVEGRVAEVLADVGDSVKQG